MPYAQLQLLLRQVDGGERKWSLSLGGGNCLRRVGKCIATRGVNPLRSPDGTIASIFGFPRLDIP